ncbi:MAG TPA: helix-turn-helix transcriptional regulator [Xanthobacteraceae bacterium]|jgi:XRE family aerobic/anaerobic benzoate catabolism transcriptional regulator
MELRPTDEQEFLAALGRRVRHVRALRGMSRKVLARVSGISERYIAQLESGKGNVSIKLLRRAASAMGTRVEDLLVDESTPPEWSIIRDLMRGASSAQVARAREILSGAAAAAAQDAARADRVALIGLRGAGKSTLGRVAAQRLGWDFIELDKEIERAHGLSTAEILALYGQEGFRRREQVVLRDLIARPGAMIVATGGGIVAEPLTFDLLLTSFHTVWLRAAPAEHMARVRQQGDLRPMGDDPTAMQELRAILTSREPLYARAHTTIETSGLAIESAAAKLLAAIAPGSA